MMELPIPPWVVREANPKFVEFLREAKQLLWDGVIESDESDYWQYICHVIDQYAALEGIRSSVYRELLDAIAQALDVDSVVPPTYDDWVSHQLSSDAWIKVVTSPNASVMFQSGRLRWLNQLIEEYGGVP